MQSLTLTASFILVGRVSSALAGFSTSVLLAANLPPSDLGVFFVVQTTVFLVVIVSLTGFPQLMVYLVPKMRLDGRFNELRELEKTAIMCVGMVSVLCLSAASATLYFALPIGIEAACYVTVWGIGMAITTVAAEVGRLNNSVAMYSFLAGQGPWGGPAIAISALASLAAIRLMGGATHIREVFQIYALLSAFWTIVAVFLSTRTEQFENVSFRPGLVKKAAHYMLVPLISVYQSTDIALFSFVIGGEGIATYGIASRLTSMASMPIATIETIFSPYLSGGFHQVNRPALARHLLISARLSQVIAGALFVFSIAFAGWFIVTFYGPAFAAASAPLAILIMGRAAAALFGPVNQLMIAAGLGSRLLRFQILGALIAVIVGAVGSAFAGQIAIASAYGMSIPIVAFLTHRDLWYRTGIDSTAVLHRPMTPEVTRND